jgi:hypothetical protein
LTPAHSANDDSADAPKLMSVLGTMMLRAGLLSENQAVAANEHAASRSISHVDAILELGLADEDTLVAFMASKLMIPRVRSAVLERVEAPVLGRIAPAMAWRWRCVPVSADELGNLTVAMLDPTDTRAVSAIAEQTHAYLVRAVASATDLRRALERHYGSEQHAREQARPAPTYVPSPSIVAPAQPTLAAPTSAPAPRPPVSAPTSAPAPLRVPHSAPTSAPAPRVPPSVPTSAPAPRVPHSAPTSAPAPRVPHSAPTSAPALRVPPSAPSAAPAPALASALGPGGYVEADRPTELGLEPIRATTAPPGIRNPAPLAPPNPITPPGFDRATSRLQEIGQIPDDDDDAVPIRRHGAAQEHSTPTPDRPPSRITDVQTTGPGPSNLPPSNPSPPLDRASPGIDDLHERTTLIEGGAGRGPRRPRAHTPWNPPLQGFHPAEPIPLSPEAFIQVVPKLEATLERDAVTAVLLDFLADGFKRVILFVHSHNELRGLDARGEDLLVEAVRQVRIPSGGKSMFSDVLERGTPYLGPIQTSNKIDQAFAQALGGIRGNVLLLPIKIGRKVPLLLWAHGTSYPVDPHSITELSAAVSAAIQRIIAASRGG